MTKNEKLQDVFRFYTSEHGHEPVTVRTVVIWGVEQGMLPRPKTVDPFDILVEQMARALGQEYDTYKDWRHLEPRRADNQGR
jgi:hypothetical protein